MKQLLLVALFSFFAVSSLKAQMGPAEKKMTANICDCISNLDHGKIQDAQSAEKAFQNCFTGQANLILSLAEERNIELNDQQAMKVLGTDIAKNLMRENCPGFMKLAIAMANKEEADQPMSGVTEGRLKRIDTKDFNYFVITDDSNKERTFIWLRQFSGSDAFVNNASKFVGKKVKINWQEIEVYVPSAKNYFNIREVTELQVL
jgi:ABC-type methionine transport system ATPase subunit